MNDLKLSRPALREAAQAWGRGGHLSLGLWLSKYKPHFTTKDYSELVAMVRVELNDDTDYSLEGEHDHAELKNRMDRSHV